MGTSCDANPGDIVWGIPDGPHPPIAYFLTLGEKKMVKAVDKGGTQRDFNPERFCRSEAEARNRAICDVWDRLSTYLHSVFDEIAAHQSGKYPGYEKKEEEEKETL